MKILYKLAVYISGLGGTALYVFMLKFAIQYEDVMEENIYSMLLVLMFFTALALCSTWTILIDKNPEWRVIREDKIKEEIKKFNKEHSTNFKLKLNRTGIAGANMFMSDYEMSEYYRLSTNSTDRYDVHRLKYIVRDGDSHLGGPLNIKNFTDKGIQASLLDFLVRVENKKEIVL